MSQKMTRPLSPHLTIWKWGPHMAVSILHRVTGGALTVAGLGLLACWLSALAKGDAAYDRFLDLAGHPVAVVVLVGLLWAFFQHLLSGIRHLVLDMGAGYELNTNRRFSWLVLLGGLVLTTLTLFLILGGAK